MYTLSNHNYMCTQSHQRLHANDCQHQRNIAQSTHLKSGTNDDCVRHRTNRTYCICTHLPYSEYSQRTMAILQRNRQEICQLLSSSKSAPCIACDLHLQHESTGGSHWSEIIIVKKTDLTHQSGQECKAPCQPWQSRNKCQIPIR